MTEQIKTAIEALKLLSEKLRNYLPQCGRQDMSNGEREMVDYLERDVPAIVAALNSLPPAGVVSLDDIHATIMRNVGLTDYLGVAKAIYALQLPAPQPANMPMLPSEEELCEYIIKCLSQEGGLKYTVFPNEMAKAINRFLVRKLGAAKQ